MKESKDPISMPEFLSAVVDDETGDFERKRVLDELTSSSALRTKMSNYALIGETMRASDSMQSQIATENSFLAGIHEQIDAEETFENVVLNQNTPNVESNSWLKPLGGFALAASVAAVAILVLQNYSILNPSGNLDATIVDSTLESANPSPQTQLTQEQMDGAINISADQMSDTRMQSNLTNESEPVEIYKQADARTRSLLKRYVDTHMQYAGTAAFVPSVRVIAYADNQ